MQGKFYQLPEKYKYSIAFESKLVPLTDEKAQKYISLASEDSLKKYFPKDVDFAKKEDCLAIAGQSFVANKINLNDDGVDTATAITIAELFPYSYIDALHKRDTIVGVILTASFTDIETNKELSKADIQDYKKPFAVTIGGLIWRLANKKLTQALESDKLKDSLYFSWELAFNDYKLIKLPKDKYDFIEGQIVDSSNVNQIKELDKKLKVNGGSGQTDDGTKIARIIFGEVIPLGVGIVENPAGQLDPLVIDNQEDTEKTKIKADIAELAKIDLNFKISAEELRNALILAGARAENAKVSFNNLIECVKNIQSVKENFTSSNLSVNQNNNTNNVMDKITDIKQITDENIKVVKASVITDFIGEELIKKDTEWKKQVEEEKKAKATADAAASEVQKQLEATKADLQKIQSKMAAKEAEELHTQRMTYFDDTYELSKEERQVIGSEIQGLDTEAFDKAKTKYDVFLKEKSKAAIKAKKDAEAAKQVQVSQASKTDVVEKAEDKEKVIDEAIKNAKQTTATVPNAQGTELSFTEKYRAAFKPEDCIQVNK